MAACAEEIVAFVGFAGFSLVASFRTDSLVDVQMRLAEISDSRADPRVVGVLVKLSVSGTPDWRPSGVGNADAVDGETQASSADAVWWRR